MSEKLKVKFAVYLVLCDGDDILLSKRQNTGYMDGMYSLVAGHVEEGESVVQAMMREAKEEAGIDIKEEDLDVLLTCHRIRQQYIDVYLSPMDYSGEITNVEPNKCEELKFFNEDNLPENVVPEVRAALQAISKGKNYITYWK